MHLENQLWVLSGEQQRQFLIGPRSQKAAQQEVRRDAKAIGDFNDVENGRRSAAIFYLRQSGWVDPQQPGGFGSVRLG